jgi:hypothetical protein
MTTQSITIDASCSEVQSTPAAQSSPRSSASPMRRMLLRLVMIGASVGIAILLGEVIVRAFHLGQTCTVFRYHDKIVKFKPHARFMNYEENQNLVQMNNLGFHDHERQLANDNYRILFMGDSFVEGRQVDTESLFTIRLEKKFAQVGQKIETINGGVLGTGTAAQYALWKEFFEPNVRVDHVVLCVFFGNDLVDNNMDLLYAAYPGGDNAFFLDSQGRIIDVGRRPGAVKRLINHVRDYSALFNTLYEGAYQMRKHWQEKSRAVPAETETKTTAKGEDHGISQAIEVNNASAWEASEAGTIASIEKWKSELAAKHLPFDVVMIDRGGGTYNRFEADFVDKLQAACARDQIGCLRLKLTGNSYDTYSFDGKYLGHFNQRGHEMAAGELYDYFRSHHGEIFKGSPK